MKKLLFELCMLVAVVLIATGCTKTDYKQYFCYVEYEGEETTYSVKYVNQINFKNTGYGTRTSSDRSYCFYHSIDIFTSGNRSVLDRIEYTINRIEGPARCTLYVASVKGYDNPLKVQNPKDFEFTEEIKAWLHENYIGKCVLEPEDHKASVEVLIEPF